MGEGGWGWGVPEASYRHSTSKESEAGLNKASSIIQTWTFSTNAAVKGSAFGDVDRGGGAGGGV